MQGGDAARGRDPILTSGWQLAAAARCSTTISAAGSREPSILDSQSVRTADSGGSKGYDAGKKSSGPKRHILTDTDGRLLAVQVHGANIQSLALGLDPRDRDGGQGVLKRSRKRYPSVQRPCQQRLREPPRRLGEDQNVLKIVRRNATAKGFEVLLRRRVIEPSLGS